jgi:hypothetical protein
MQIDSGKNELADAVMDQALREMTMSQRLAIANRMWLSARKAIYCILRSEHPHWTNRQIQEETARRMLHEPI